MRRWLRHLEEALLGAILLVMSVMVLAQVISRYFLHQSISYTEEVVRYLFVWSVFLGISAGVRRGEHLRVTALHRRLSSRAQRWLNGLGWAVMALFFLLVARTGWEIVQLQIRTGQKTAALGMPAWWLGFSVPVGSCFVVFRCIERIVQDGRRKEGE